ncbi:hypothetical protein D6C99_10460 [Aureobasidium pullulans]|nr:hypothetical protein D6C99_10460 [Aureobasidium pullulans]
MKNFSALVALLFASAQAVAGDSTKTLRTCLTKQGTASIAKVPSTTYGLTITKTAVQVITSTPSTTFTPAPTTTTLTSTSTTSTTTTLSQVTDTYTDTITLTNTETDTTTAATTTITETSSTTTTTSTGISTVPVPSGFTALGDYISGAAKKRSPNGRFDARAATPATKTYCKIANGKVTMSPASYPKAVTCAQLVQIIKTSTKTQTAFKTTTITAATPIITSSTTTTTTVTSTISLIDASTTTTETDTSTTTTTITVTPSTTTTTTTTITVLQPTATVFAQCAANNLIGSVNGAGFYGAGADNYATADAPSATDCCNICANTASCEGFAYYGTCYILYASNDGCFPGQSRAVFYAGGGIGPGDGYVIGNGQCGEYSNGSS